MTKYQILGQTARKRWPTSSSTTQVSRPLDTIMIGFGLAASVASDLPDNRHRKTCRKQL